MKSSLLVGVAIIWSIFVDISLAKENDNWKITTDKKKTFLAPNIIIAGGVGSFESRKFSVKNGD